MPCHLIEMLIIITVLIFQGVFMVRSKLCSEWNIINKRDKVNNFSLITKKNVCQQLTEDIQIQTEEVKHEM